MALEAGTTGSAFEYDSSGGFYIQSAANANVGQGQGTAQFFMAGGAPANTLYINSSGYVGVGTNPGQRFDVAGGYIRSDTGFCISANCVISLWSNPLTTLGDLLYEGPSGAARLAGNTSATPMYLKSVGASGAATAPTLAQIQFSDIAGTLGISAGGTGQTSFSAGLLRSSGSALSSAELSGDCTTSGSNAVTCTKTNGVSFAPSATADTTNAANITSGVFTTAREPNTTVNSISNDTNVTGAIAAQNLTLGWTGQLSIARGGTGQTTAAAAFNALSPLTSEGDLPYYSSSSNARLTIGGANTFLTSNGTDPSWGSLTGAGFGSQSANTFLAAPNGSSGNPSFRALAGSDLPTIAISGGGTGQTTAAAAFNVLSPLTAEGDLLYYHSSASTRLGVGTNGQCLTSNGTDPVWGSCSSGGGGANYTLSNLTSPTSINLSVLTFSGAAGITAGGTNQNVTLTPSGSGYTLLNGSIGIGTTTPSAMLEALTGVSDFRFSQGNANATPSLEVINTSGLAAALVAGTIGSTFNFDDAGWFGIQADAHSNFAGNSLGNGILYLRINGNGNIGIGTNYAPTQLFDVNGQFVVNGSTGNVGVSSLASATGIPACFNTSAIGGFNTLSSCNGSLWSNPMATMGDLVYGAASGAVTRLAGNISSAKNFLISTGSSGAATAPLWGTIASSDLPGSGITTISSVNCTIGSSCTMTSLNGVSYPASPSINTVPVVTSSNTITYETVPFAALPSTLVYDGQANSYSTGLQNFNSATLEVPSSSSYAPTTASLFGYDSTNNRFVGGNGTNTSYLTWITSGPSSLDLPEFSGTTGLLADSSIAAASVVTLTGTQTLTNKTLTSPTVSGAISLATSSAPTATSGYNNVWADSATGNLLAQLGTASSGPIEVRAISTQTTAYSVKSTDSTILCSGTFTVTLPTSGIPTGKSFRVKNISTGVCTVSAGGTVDIDGATTYVIATPYAAAEFQWNGTQYYVF
jgi:hypothetical protein